MFFHIFLNPFSEERSGKKRIKQQDSWEQQFSPFPIWLLRNKENRTKQVFFFLNPKIWDHTAVFKHLVPPIPYTFSPTKHDPSLVTYWLLYMVRYRTTRWIFSQLERWVNKAIYQETKKCMHSVSKRLRRKKRKEISLKILLIGITLTIAWAWRGWSWKLRYSEFSLMAMHSAATIMKCSWGASSTRGSGDRCQGWKFIFSLSLSLSLTSYPEFAFSVLVSLLLKIAVTNQIFPRPQFFF